MVERIHCPADLATVPLSPAPRFLVHDEALEEAGLPLIDERDEEGHRRWRLLNWRSEAA